MNISSVTPSASNTLVRFVGIPGRNCDVQSTTNPVETSWPKIGDITIGAMGYVIFTDTNEPVGQFYRTARPEQAENAECGGTGVCSSGTLLQACLPGACAHHVHRHTSGQPHPMARPEGFRCAPRHALHCFPIAHAESRMNNLIYGGS